MKPKIGIIQVRGIGDAVIAMPIAQYYKNTHDAEVFFALDDRFCDDFTEVFGSFCKFIPVPYSSFVPSDGINNEYWYELPKTMLENAGCKEIISFPYHETHLLSKINENVRQNFPYGQLMKRLNGPYESRVTNLGLFNHLKFDEYKYATAMVPFSEKWNLHLDSTKIFERGPALLNKVTENLNGRKLVLCHLEGSDAKIDASGLNIPEDTHLIVEIKPGIAESIFDWIYVAIASDMIICIDSFYANLFDQTQQLFGYPDKHFIKRSSIFMTPVLNTRWNYVVVN